MLTSLLLSWSVDFPLQLRESNTSASLNLKKQDRKHFAHKYISQSLYTSENGPALNHYVCISVCQHLRQIDIYKYLFTINK